MLQGYVGVFLESDNHSCRSKKQISTGLLQNFQPSEGAKLCETYGGKMGESL